MAEKKKKEMQDYSQKVLENATDYNAQLEKEAKDKEDAKNSMSNDLMQRCS